MHLKDARAALFLNIKFFLATFKKKQNIKKFLYLIVPKIEGSSPSSPDFFLLHIFITKF